MIEQNFEWQSASTAPRDRMILITWGDNTSKYHNNFTRNHDIVQYNETDDVWDSVTSTDIYFHEKDKGVYKILSWCELPYQAIDEDLPELVSPSMLAKFAND